MGKAEGCRVQHQAFRSDLRARKIADVHFFTDQRMTAFGQMDADLMCLAGFEFYFAQRRAPQFLDG